MWCDVSLSNIMGILIAGYPLVVYPVTYMKVWNASMVSCSENDLHSWFWFSTWQSWPAGNSLSVCYGKSPFLNVVPSGKLLHNYGKSPCYQWVNPRTKWQFSIANCWSLPEGSMRINLPGFISNAPHQASLLLILSALRREQDFSDWGSVWPWVWKHI